MVNPPNFYSYIEDLDVHSDGRDTDDAAYRFTASANSFLQYSGWTTMHSKLSFLRPSPHSLYTLVFGSYAQPFFLVQIQYPV